MWTKFKFKQRNSFWLFCLSWFPCCCLEISLWIDDFQSKLSVCESFVGTKFQDLMESCTMHISSLDLTQYHPQYEHICFSESPVGLTLLLSVFEKRDVWLILLFWFFLYGNLLSLRWFSFLRLVLIALANTVASWTNASMVRLNCGWIPPACGVTGISSCI